MLYTFCLNVSIAYSFFVLLAFLWLSIRLSFFISCFTIMYCVISVMGLLINNIISTIKATKTICVNGLFINVSSIFESYFLQCALSSRQPYMPYLGLREHIRTSLYALRDLWRSSQKSNFPMKINFYNSLPKCGHVDLFFYPTRKYKNRCFFRIAFRTCRYSGVSVLCKKHSPFFWAQRFSADSFFSDSFHKSFGNYV